MRRDLRKAKRLLQMVQTHADENGIVVLELGEKWRGFLGVDATEADAAECVYLTHLLVGEGYLSLQPENLVQLTWAGHDYLDVIIGVGPFREVI